MAHRPLDGLGGMRPAAFVVRIVVGPHDVVDEAVDLDEVEARPVFPERGEAVETEVLAGELRELRPHPEVMLEIRLVHGGEEPGQPPDARLDRGEAQAGEALEHAGGAQVGRGLDSRGGRVGDVVYDGATVATGRAGVAPRRDVK